MKSSKNISEDTNSFMAFHLVFSKSTVTELAHNQENCKQNKHTLFKDTQIEFIQLCMCCDVQKTSAPRGSTPSRPLKTGPLLSMNKQLSASGQRHQKMSNQPQGNQRRGNN
ncbi:uncharacterized protein LOC122499676 [Leptopilina heterotoma]|uniref:uncharacterized protein LOC122499676 n=1 Tax=Leptopilina heterotoma TaxID=63436 RepID=UPI001CA9076C|nr:uncharacterized protein LOC122499676 [Leptopilina heterotoma]